MGGRSLPPAEAHEEQEVRGPLVFQCSGCRSVVGDSFSLNVALQDLDIVVLNSEKIMPLPHSERRPAYLTERHTPDSFVPTRESRCRAGTSKREDRTRCIREVSDAPPRPIRQSSFDCSISTVCSLLRFFPCRWHHPCASPSRPPAANSRGFRAPLAQSASGGGIHTTPRKITSTLCEFCHPPLPNSVVGAHHP